MANNYVQFSLSITVSNTELAWWQAVEKHFDEGTDPPEGCNTSVFDEPECAPCVIDINDNTVLLYSEESGNVEDLVTLIQQFLVAQNPTGAVDVEFALTCSKPRTNEFGGGAAYVTATRIAWLSTSNWLREQRAEEAS